MRKLKGKTKVIVGIAAGALAVGMASAPAFASTTSYDYFGAYTSSNGGAQLVGGDSVNGIEWVYGDLNNIGNNHDEVYVTLKDTAADGGGPILRARDYDSAGRLNDIHDFHWTGGNGTTSPEMAYKFSGSLSTNPYDGHSITVQVCSGYSSGGIPQNCGSLHGPFHSY